MLALHGVLAVLLCLVPLFDVLGFERAFATGLITTPAAAALAVAAHRAAPDARPVDVAWAASALGLLALLPTLLAGLGVELWTSPCSPGEGLVFLVLGFTPGGLSFIGDFLMQSPNMPWLFFGGAALVFCVLAWRIYRRLRPAQKKKSAPTPHVTPTPKFSLRREKPPE